MNLTRETLRRSRRAWIDSDVDNAGPAWLQWVWTLLFAAAIALGFTILGFVFNARGAEWLSGRNWLHWYRMNFVVSLTIAVIIHLLFLVAIPLIGRVRLRRLGHRRRALFFTGVPILGVLAGWPLGLWLLGSQTSRWIRLDDPGNLVGSAILALSISFLFFLFFNAKAHQAIAEKRAAEAQLRLLQAQMEPHFLFNTLASVLTLIDAEPARAKAMLESFTDYLRSTLTSLRKDDSTLGHELDLAAAYLKLLHLRMEDRLRFTITTDSEARAAVLPPLLLQPLVENAIQHGLEPQLDGGSLAITAQVRGDELHLSVTDDGRGADAAKRHGSGNGIALENIRQRLQALYGTAATLSIESQHPGTRATLRLPFHRSPACPWP